MSKCTYLGLQDDPKTALEFASDGNFCHHALPAAPPNPGHQKAFCLSNEHISCPVFLLSEKRPLPKDVIFHDYKRNLNKKVVYRGILLAILFVLLAAALVGAWGLKGILSTPIVVPEGTIRVTSIQPPLVIVTNRSISPTSPGPPTNPTSTLIPTVSDCTPPDGWILYTVIPTDSIFRLSLIFGISVTELLSVNCLGDDIILRPGDQIYVPSFLTSTPAIDTQSPTPTDTLQPKPTSPPRPRPTFPIRPTRTSPPANTPTPVIPTSTPPPPSPTTHLTNTIEPQPATPTSESEPSTPTSPPPLATPTSPPLPTP